MPAGIIKGNYRPGSVRGLGQRVAYEKHQVSRWVFNLGRLVGTDSTVFKAASALAAVIGHDGRLDPTHGWIAEKIGVCVKSVTRALRKLRALGFLTWQRRVAVTAGIEHQTSNAYQLLFPEAPPALVETPQRLSTLPSSAMSHNKENNISGEEESWDTPLRTIVSRHAVRQAEVALAKARETVFARMARPRRWFRRASRW